MEIKVKKTKEFKKGGFLEGDRHELVVEISVSLSEEEKALIKKYFDPWVDITDISKDLRVATLNVAEITHAETKLSNFKITARVRFAHLICVETFEKVIITKLTESINYLRALDKWQGEKIINV